MSIISGNIIEISIYRKDAYCINYSISDEEFCCNNMEIIDYDVYLKHILKNDIIIELYACFMLES